MQLEINPKLRLREWRDQDEKRLVSLANNDKIARNLMDVFPHPYTKEDARHWIKTSGEEKEKLLLAIEFNGELVGAIGAHFKSDVYKYNCELGYWIGEPYWGKGIASACIDYFTNYLFQNYKINRVYGDVFSNNPASGKVLEKNGFKKEATLEKAAFKNGFFIDIWVYSKLKN